ncbi:MAG: bifunctional diaminohydroxyphosphoribosylaminopyrimidine deaminase/5-amino-6-(5-phosphoribosylamino)uracil reductase RibD, partial [Hyphococcus sp.]
MSDAQKKDIIFMREALALAARGAGATAPNPMVGCVLVKNGKVIGAGWHEAAGKDHAEVAALKDAGDGARGATAYVTLEPCNHTGRTGPCTEALIDAGIAEVVYALADPNPVAAGGATRLLTAGVKVRGGVCADQARALNRGWIHAGKHKRPYIIGKTAMTLDGRIATAA